MGKRKPKTRARTPRTPSCWVYVSDLHCGCQMGLCPPEGARLDDGGRYKPNRIQRAVWGYWRQFWDAWVPEVTDGAPVGVVVVGDSLDGVHHGSVGQISHNLSDQARIAYEVLAPVAEYAEGRLHILRGTEAHVGPSAQEEERLAERLGAVPNRQGQRATYELWQTIRDPQGRPAALVHCLHHIGTTGSNAYEATAVHKELTEEFTEAARWGERRPDYIIRAHRHRLLRSEIATGGRQGKADAIVLPGWQAKTSFAWKIAGGRLAPPQFGGVVIIATKDEVYSRHKVWHIGRGRPVG